MQFHCSPRNFLERHRELTLVYTSLSERWKHIGNVRLKLLHNYFVRPQFTYMLQNLLLSKFTVKDLRSSICQYDFSGLSVLLPVHSNIVKSCQVFHIFAGNIRKNTEIWGRPDSNQRPPAPKARIIPS